MAKEKKQLALALGAALFMVYFIGAARPIPRETVLVSRWLSSLESGYPASGGEAAEDGAEAGELLPFTLGGRFGYVDANGRFSINRAAGNYLSYSPVKWAEYGAEPARIEIRDALGRAAGLIENPAGYPSFFEERTFILGSDQNALFEIGGDGTRLWSHEFSAPLTCMAAAPKLVLTGSLDGVVELLDSGGKQVFVFEPGGSRYPVILGCAISRDGSRLGIISGIDDQRFLLLERFGGGEYKVIYHEFLGDGFRRPVHIEFVDRDRWLVYEREGGLGLYEMAATRGTSISLNGEIAAIDRSGGQGLYFVITALQSGQKELIGIQLPGRVIIRSPFKSEDAFLGRTGSRLYIGGGLTLAAFELEKK